MTIQTLIDADTLSTEVEQHNDYLTRREAAGLCRVPLSTFDSLRRQNRFPFPDNNAMLPNLLFLAIRSLPF